MNETVDIDLPIKIIITIEGIIGTIFNIAATAVVFNVHFGTKFTTFIFRAQPIFDLSACLLTTIYYIIQFTENYNRSTGLYIIDILFCHFWFRNALFWLPCILSVQNLVCISLDRVSSVIFVGLHRAYSNKFFLLYFFYMISMVLLLYSPVPLLRRYDHAECIMDFSFPWIKTRVFIEYVVYSWAIFAYFMPILVMLISHVWVIHAIKMTQSPHHCSLSQNVESSLKIKQKIHQLVITTAIMSLQQAVLHSFECIVKILITNGVMIYTYGTPVEQLGTFLILLGCMSNPCILVFSTTTLRRRLSTSFKSISDRMSTIGGIGQLTKSSTQ
ncbi:hypothetical protein EWB00_006858 [Schistosoma japonicum]|uniref:G-protein coupled receptors family 1 profile domain-containing protein n=1 Tax=Schistosoma japonicum TaxID=6182 RepID=A0A4Z2CXK4_SCHJA|nr:hypothetical protein EWB00_006858 [Schistosoma japonicum]